MLTRTSSRPSEETACSTSAPQLSAFDRSAWSATARRPDAAISLSDRLGFRSRAVVGQRDVHAPRRELGRDHRPDAFASGDQNGLVGQLHGYVL